MPDTLGYRKYFGVIVPSVNTVAQPEFEAMRPPGITNQTARIHTPLIPLVDDASFVTHVNTMRSGIARAVAEIATCKPDHLIMGLSLETFWDGLKGSRELRASLERQAGCGVSMGSEAILVALSVYDGVKRIAILTPHPPLGNQKVREFFAEAGYEVVRLRGLDFRNAVAIARVSEDELRRALIELNGTDVQALVQVGTNLPMARLAGEAERWLGKPVLAINTATYWHALRQNKVDDRVAGFGSLLAAR
jgi:maleate isomerase